MHSNHIRGVRLEPAIQLVFVGDVDGEKAAVALVIAVVFGVFAVVLCLTGAYEVDGGPFGGLKFLPEFGAPADDFSDAVAERHISDGGVCGLSRGCRYEGQEGECENCEADHGDSGDGCSWTLPFLVCVV
jgi:hypothetical protein